MANKAIFLDQDGTLIEDAGYINNPNQVKLLEGVPEALIELRKLGYLLVVVSNQSGIARGIVTERVLGQVHDRLKELLAQKGTFIDRIYYCPYHPEAAIARYRKESNLRKPQPGMLLAAAKDMDIDLVQSWLIGDAGRDIEAGSRAGCKTILASRSLYYQGPEPGQPRPDYKCLSLREAANMIKQHHRSAGRNENSAQSAAPVQEKDAPSRIESTGQSEPRGQQQSPAPDHPEEPEPAQPTQLPETTAAGAVTTEELLRAILEQLRTSHRSQMFAEFSVTRLVAGVLQIIVLFCILMSAWLLLDPSRQPTSVLIALGFAVLFQLMSLTFYLMQDRK